MASDNNDFDDRFDEFEEKARQYTKLVLELLEDLSIKTGMPVEQMAQIVVCVCLFFTLLGTCQSIISNFIGIIYPAFKSF